jgi:hypothetical protein
MNTVGSTTQQLSSGPDNRSRSHRSWTEGLERAALGSFDNRALRFVSAAELQAGQGQPAYPAARLPDAEVKVENVRPLGSYTWTGEESPAILIPGSFSL